MVEPALFLRFEAVNFGATITDTQDLATIRGASVAALRLAPSLARHIGTQFPDWTVETLYASASEGVLRLTPKSPETEAPLVPAPQPRPIPVPKGKSRNGWPRDIERLANRLLREGRTEDATIEAEARRFWEKEGGSNLKRQSGDSYPVELVIEAVTARVGAARETASAGRVADDTARRLEAVVREFVRQGTPAWRRLTVLPATYRPTAKEDIEGTLAILQSRIRSRQLQELTVPIPDEAESGFPKSDDAVCRVTGVLPADSRNSPSFERRSRSVIDRRRSGVKQKQDFYEDQLREAARHAVELAREVQSKDIFNSAAEADTKNAIAILRKQRRELKAKEIGFAESFKDIVDPPGFPLSPAVAGKLAVIHLDGNNFGKARATRTDFYEFRRFSRYLEVKGGLLLAGLFDWMLGRDSMKVATAAKEEDEAPVRLRFETLLWGGDEMCFVLPAWEAWDFMGVLLKQLVGWRQPEKDRSGDLTFKIGMVFGQAKTPIRDLRSAAETLSRLAKGDGTATRVQAMTLEGIDRADNDPEELRKEQFGDMGKAASAWSIAGEGWQQLTDDTRELLRKAGASQLHRGLREAERKRIGEDKRRLLSATGAEAVEAVKDLMERLQTLGVPDSSANLLAEPRLAKGADEWPFLPLVQLVKLRDFIMAGVER